MSDTSFFAETEITRYKFLGIEHGKTEIGITVYGCEMLNCSPEFGLSPAEARKMANDLLRRADLVESERSTSERSNPDAIETA
ncbi:MAG: hypothetical protein ABIH23_08365 [bacterium]